MYCVIYLIVYFLRAHCDLF